MNSPPTKRIKLEPTSPIDANIDAQGVFDLGELENTDGEHCSICLQPYADRTMIPKCSHEFCFECLLIWTEQSRRCPLCSQDVGKYLMHNIRSKYDYQKHYLVPLRKSPQMQMVEAVRADARRQAVRQRAIEWGRRRRRELAEADELDRAIEKRRWVYRHHLYAKHVASNPYTRYRPFPTPAQFSASPDYVSRATVFIRRELLVWTGLDVEFLTAFTVSLMKSLDIRSEPAVRLLCEFLDMDAERGHERANAEHFAHELYCYLRSPYRELSAYDNNVQYDVPTNVPPPDVPERRGRWRSRSPSSSRSRSRPRYFSSRRSPLPSRRGSPASRSISSRSASPSNHPDASPLQTCRRREVDSRPGSSRRTLDENCSHRGRRRSQSRSTRTASSSPLSNSCSGERSSSLHRGSPLKDLDRHHGKGKYRAADDHAARPRHRSAARRLHTHAVGGGVHAGTECPMDANSISHSNIQNSLLVPVQTTPSSVTIAPAATAQNPDTSHAGAQNTSDNECDGQRRLTVGIDTSDIVQRSNMASTSKQEGAPVRIRRSAWQTMQQHLASGGKAPRSSKRREEVLASDLVPSSKSQAQTLVNPASLSISPHGALRPEAPPPSSDDAVPSLLLRLSDPVVTASGAPQNATATDGDLDSRSHRTTLSVAKGGKGITVPEMMARTRARSARTSAGGDYSSVASQLRPPTQHTQHPGAAGRNSNEKHDAEGTGDVGAVEVIEHMSSASEEIIGQSAGGAGGPTVKRSRATFSDTDPRFLLMQKLELEKRKARATVVPTAEKAQLSPSSNAARDDDSSSVSMTLVSSDGTGEKQKPAPGVDVVAADRTAERRETELRSQAQLRVRLAAAKRAAIQMQTQTQNPGISTNANMKMDTVSLSGRGAGSSTSDGLMSQERELKSRLRARKA